MKSVALFGATSVEMIDLVLDCITAGADWNLVGFFDDNPSIQGSKVEGLPVLGAAGDLVGPQWKDLWIVNNVGANCRVRHIVHDKLFSIVGERLLTVAHPSARISTDAIGIGSVVQSGSTISRGAKLGAGCLINFNCLVAHGSVLGNACVLAPGVIVNGNCSLDHKVYVGSGAILMPKSRIGHDAIVGVGSVVMSPVKAETTVLGNPARNFQKLGSS